MAGISIREAVESDYPAIARIQQGCPEAAQWPVGDYSNYRVLLALWEGVPAGFCAWRTVAPGESELLNLAVDPTARRKGIASALLTSLGMHAEDTIFLEVAENNRAALALYRAGGWICVDTRLGYYQHGTVNGIVMKKSSC
ncbi:MAG: N-acetyltransferase [Terriglobia bacterium]